ncbi:MAG: DNA repair protein RecN [Alphaproteobacteria bacterium]|nr:DNA repair protein RecN [Alphaproteobacteria bacterium]
MLASLTIQNIVLIDRLVIEFKPGLCALTGETGAGKSILLDALGLSLGARSESGVVRKGAEQAQVTAEFEIPPAHPVFAVLAENGLEAESPLILRRAVAGNGRSRAFINDQPVSVSLLSAIGALLVEIHGQFETQGLLNPRMHKILLDDYAAKPEVFQAVRTLWAEWRKSEVALKALRETLQKAREEEAFLRQSLEDLDALAPEAGEEEKLTSARTRLMKRDQYLQSLGKAGEALANVEAAMGTAWRALEKLEEEAAREMVAGMDRAAAEIQEVISGIQSFSGDLEEGEYALTEIDDRLYALKTQARKHGCSVDDLAARRDEMAAALNALERQDDTLTDLARSVEKNRKAYIEKAGELTRIRSEAGRVLEKLVMAELAPLKLDKARFITVVEPQEENVWGPEGVDRVQFLIATNPGAEPGPINKIASGGEMARFMLALKVVLAETGAAGTLVFDEVDSGIGGGTADAVGERLARLASGKNSRQILVVTHSPQVAAQAQHHYVVSKSGDHEVRTNIALLPSAEERREEIARMLSGATITQEARAAAGKLLDVGR